MVYSKNDYLTLPEMTVNATYLMDAFLGYGWSKNAIAGMLGNMQVESTINPGIWEGLNEGNMSRGYGLVQWTPARSYIVWANDFNYDIGDINGQIARIIYEVNNNMQYIQTPEYPLSFREFTQSTQSPEYLASAFLKNYERAGVQEESIRRSNARYWFNNLTGEGGGGQPCFPTSPESVVTSPYGWRVHPLTNERTFHAGTDFASPSGTSQPVFATQSGTVTENRFSESGGWMVYIKHEGDPYHSRYLHLNEKSPIAVGTKVAKCQQIGMTGSTGNSTGIHLHFEVATSQEGFGSENGTIDPEVYLQMNFGGGGGSSSTTDHIIHLLLSDSLNGWNY